MIRFKRPTLVLLLVLVTLPASPQSTPTVMNYQGRLTDNSPGQDPIDGTLSMDFKIYGSLVGADLLWSESWGSVTVNGGIFNVVLGNSGSPLPASLFSGGTTRYLEIVVNGEVLSPRQQLGAAGWAHQAEHAADVECADCVQSSDIQNSTIVSQDIAPNAITAADLATDSVQSSEIADNSVGNSELNNAQSFTVSGLTALGSGVSSYTTSGVSVLGSGGATGVYGDGTGTGVYGMGNGWSGDVYGVYGQAVDTGVNSYGVYGVGGDYGVYGSGASFGAYGQGGGVGVYGNGTQTGVWGDGLTGVFGQGSSYGVLGRGGAGIGVQGEGEAHGLYGNGQATVGLSKGVSGYALGAGGDIHYGGFFSAGGATTNYGVWAIGSTAAGFFSGEVYVERNSLTTEPHVELFETGNDYARIKFRNNAAPNHFWDIAGYASETRSEAWLNFYSQGYGDVLRIRGDGYTWFGLLGAGYANTLCSSNVGFGYIGNCSSSQRYKEDLLDLDLGLRTVLEMRPVTFRWIRDGVADLGFVAEEMSELAPILVTTNADGEPESVRYRQLTAVLARAIQEQQDEIEELRSRLAALEAD